MEKLVTVATSSGLLFDLAQPHPNQVRLSDIACHLSRLYRFNGGTAAHAWSVAAHSLLVMQLLHRDQPDAEPQLRMAALLHDAHEAYVGDLTSPVKWLLQQRIPNFEWNWDCVVQPIQRAIHVSFGLPGDLPIDWHEAIKDADQRALYVEQRDLMRVRWMPAQDVAFEPLEPAGSPASDESDFVDCAMSLMALRHGVRA